MIIKASSRKGGAKLAHYLLSENSQQKVRQLDHRGSIADDLSTMLRYWEAEALATTKGEKALYHVKMRLSPGEQLKAEQWLQIIDRLEQKLKLTEHPRAIVVHNLKGEDHLHVVYSRLDSTRGILRQMSYDAKAHHAVAREMERKFGLRELDSRPRRDRNGNDRTRSIEHRMAKEAGIKRQSLCTVLRAAWEASDTGRAFQEHLLPLGITITRGEKRDYNVWHKGKRYDPVRLLENIRLPEFRAKMQVEPPIIDRHTILRETSATDILRPARSRSLTHGEITGALTPDNTLGTDRTARKHEFMRRVSSTGPRDRGRSREADR